MSEQQRVEIDLDKLRAQMLRDVITEEQIDLLFALIEDLNNQRSNLLRVVKEEHARMAALMGASQDMLNQLVLLCRENESRLWQLGGAPFENAYQQLRAAVQAVRPQADALLAELAKLRAANAGVALINASYLGALSAAYEALQSYAHGNSAPDLAKEVAAHVLATIESVGKT